MYEENELAEAKKRMLALTDRLLDLKVKRMADEVRKDLGGNGHGILAECTEKFADVRVTMAEVQGDISHIKVRIDEGIAPTLKSINETLIALKPKIDDHDDIIRGLKGIGWWIVYGLIGGVVSTIVWAISKGLKF